jgi:hypothetical protein
LRETLASGAWLLRSAVLAAAIALPVAGCGGADDRTNALRPPSPINVAVKIGDDRVSVSPTKFGAGPLTLLASNQSSASHRLTVDGPQLQQSSGPINPQDTATLQVTVTPGDLTISVDGSSSIKPAKVTVGPKRPSGQNDLLLP